MTLPLDGIRAASDAGLAVKINMVALKGLNDAEFEGMLRWCGDKGYDLTLIETMPLGEWTKTGPTDTCRSTLSNGRSRRASP